MLMTGAHTLQLEMARLLVPSRTCWTNNRFCHVPFFKQPYTFHPQLIHRSSSPCLLSSYSTSNGLPRQGRCSTNPRELFLSNRHYSTGISPPAPSRPTIPYRAILALILGLGTTGAIVYALDNEDTSNTQKQNALNDPLDALLPENLKEKTGHVMQKTNADLIRSYVTMLVCEIPGVASYGPNLLNGCISFRDNIPVVGPLVWSGLEWIIYNTFFTHYVGGESIQDCQSVIESMYNGNVGALLNYSVEASEKPGASNQELNNCQICTDSMQTILQAVETLANHKITSGGEYDAKSAKMKPFALAIKISGLVNDPYLFKRASENLSFNHLSPFRAEGEIFPVTSNQSDPLSESDHVALQDLMSGLRSICQKAQAADIVLMMDAEYSWFQPALDRIVTFLSAEFNQAQHNKKFQQPSSPTVFNTFQTLLQSTPARLDAFLKDGQEQGYSIGIKLVRGAYLISETNHWQEENIKGKLDSSEPLPVWSSKAETDECFDTIASSLVSRLCNSARQAEKDGISPNSNETTLMIAGHNPLSVFKVLKQLREQEVLAETKDYMGRKGLQLSNSLRGRVMFAQLYGMADNLTSTLTQILAPSDSGEKQLQPFVFKYLPFGPVEKVLPYLARRAEENQSILHVPNGDSPLTLERKRLGKEIRRRLFSFISFS